MNEQTSAQKLEQARWATDYLHRRAWQYELKSLAFVVAAGMWVIHLLNLALADMPAKGSIEGQAYGFAVLLGFAAMGWLIAATLTKKNLRSPAATFVSHLNQGADDEQLFESLTGDTGGGVSVITSADDYLARCARRFHTGIAFAAGSFVLGFLWVLIW